MNNEGKKYSMPINAGLMLGGGRNIATLELACLYRRVSAQRHSLAFHSTIATVRHGCLVPRYIKWQGLSQCPSLPASSLTEDILPGTRLQQAWENGFLVLQ